MCVLACRCSILYASGAAASSNGGDQTPSAGGGVRKKEWQTWAGRREETGSAKDGRRESKAERAASESTGRSDTKKCQWAAANALNAGCREEEDAAGTADFNCGCHVNLQTH